MSFPPRLDRLGRAVRRATVPAALVLVLAACGSDEAADAPTATDVPAGTESMDSMPADSMPMDDMDTDEMDMGAMNMGDPDATPADEVDGAALARGDFELMDTRPAGYDDVAGTAVIARGTHGTTVTTELTGLKPNVDYISHLHAQACDDDNAGPHYQFEVGGSTTPPNEIHLAFTSDNDGNGFMTAENDDVAGVEAVAFVVHPAEFIDNKIACVDFVEDEPGSIDAAVATGATHDTDDGNLDTEHDTGHDTGHDAEGDDDADHTPGEDGVHGDHGDHGDHENENEVSE